MSHKAGHVLLLHHAVLQQLRAADDALQGRFQLVGNVGGELPPVLLGKGALRHVEHQQHRARCTALRLDAADVELILSAAAPAAELAVALLRRSAQSVAEGHIAVHRQDILPHTGIVGAQQALGRRVDAEDGAVLVQQHQALVHAAGDLLEFLGPLLQFVHLPVDLAALVLHPPQQGRQLLIGIVLQRVLQIQAVQRLSDTLGQPSGQHAGQDQHRDDQQQKRLQHIQHQHTRRHADGGQAQHRAIRQELGVVYRLLQQGTAVPAGLSPSP